MVKILQGDCREVLKTLPDGSVNCCVTSPPYFGLRDYKVDGQIGLEQTPDAYVAELVAVFREVRRVLADDGTLWLNLRILTAYKRLCKSATRVSKTRRNDAPANDRDLTQLHKRVQDKRPHRHSVVCSDCVA